MKYGKLFLLFLLSFIFVNTAQAYTFDTLDYSSFTYSNSAPVFKNEESSKYYSTIEEACKAITVWDDSIYNGYKTVSTGQYECLIKTNLGDSQTPQWWIHSNGTVTTKKPYFSGMAYSGRTDRYHASEICYDNFVFRVDGAVPQLTESGANGTINLFLLQTYPTGSFCTLKSKQVTQSTTSSTPPTEVNPPTGGGSASTPASTTPPTSGGGNTGGGYEGGGGNTGGGGAGVCYDDNWEEIPCKPSSSTGSTDTPDDNSNSNNSYLNEMWDWLKSAFDGISNVIGNALKAIAEVFTSVFGGIFERLFDWLDGFKTWATNLFNLEDSGTLPEVNDIDKINQSKKSETEVSNQVLGTSSYDDYITKTETNFKFNTSASCPSDIQLMPTISADMVLSYQPICDFAIKVNPIIVAFAYLSAIYLLVKV